MGRFDLPELLAWAGGPDDVVSRAWLAVCLVVLGCSGSPTTPPSTGGPIDHSCIIDCPEGRRCVGNQVQESRYEAMRGPASDCSWPAFLDRCFRNVQTCEVGCRDPLTDDASWCVEEQAPREGDACSTDADCADAGWVIFENALRKPELRCDPTASVCAEDPSHEWCDGDDDDEDGRVDESCELHASSSYVPGGVRGLAIDADRLFVGAEAASSLRIIELGVPPDLFVGEGVGCFDVLEGRLDVVTTVEGATRLEADASSPSPSIWALESLTAPESLHRDGSQVRVVGEEEIVSLDADTGATTWRVSLPPRTMPLQASRVDTDLVVCTGGDAQWVALDGTVTTVAGCGEAMADREAFVLREGGHELGRLTRAGYERLSTLPATGDPSPRVVALGAVAIRASIEHDETHAFLVLTRVEAGVPSTTRRRLDEDAVIVDSASGDSVAALQLEVRGTTEHPDSGVLFSDAGPATLTASYVIRIE